MQWFGVRKRGTDSMQGGDPDEVAARLDTALTSIFSEDGKRTVMYYMTNKYGVTLEQASLDPSRLEKAMTGMLGEIGWMVVKRAILEQFWDRKIGIDETNAVKGASLREVFGLFRGLSLGFSYRPF